MEIADMTHDITTLAHLTAREPDAALLGTIAGAEYHEIRYVLKTEADGSHQIVGRAGDWPLIQLRAEKTELEALLTAETAHAAQAEQHIAELLVKQDAAEQHVARLRAELDQAALIPPRVAAAATGLVVVERVLFSCPACPKQFGSNQALAVHRTRAHGERAETKAIESPAEPPASVWTCATCKQPGTPSINEPDRCKSCVRKSIATVALSREMPGWRCANVACSGAFTQSLKNSAYCTECAKEQPLASTNGHALEVGGAL
jgi:hypothetical protein